MSQQLERERGIPTSSTFKKENSDIYFLENWKIQSIYSNKLESSIFPFTSCCWPLQVFLEMWVTISGIKSSLKTIISGISDTF